jgi:16S rRNA (adenine(1408)-N(1))-methyltransferase
METIRGRKSLELDFDGLKKRFTGCNRILLDLGTGDGRYVHYLAENNPGWFVIGLDTCRENLRERSQAKFQNILFVIASAQELSHELNGLVSHVSINFPWGSLLDSLLTGDSKLFSGLAFLSPSTTSVAVLLNGGALKEAGWTLETGADQIYSNMIKIGWHVETPALMDAYSLKAFPTTWAKRLAFGRYPCALELRGWFSR